MNHPPATLDQLEGCIGPAARTVLARILNTQDHQKIEKAFACYLDCYSAHGILDNRPYPGVREMLTRLKAAEVRIFLATSKLTENAKRILKKFSMDQFFEAVCGCERDGSMSDKRELVAALIEKYQLPVSNTAIVGDREHDIKAGRANRIFTVGVSYGYGSVSEISAAGPDVICASPQQVSDLLVEHPAR
jgi:phosphoglycolate phosphatase